MRLNAGERNQSFSINRWTSYFCYYRNGMLRVAMTESLISRRASLPPVELTLPAAGRRSRSGAGGAPRHPRPRQWQRRQQLRELIQVERLHQVRIESGLL